MDWVLLTAEQVIRLHDRIIGPQELQGLAAGKSLESALARVENRLYYALDIEDVYVLAACTAQAVAVAHAFNDANKRTAAVTLGAVLRLNRGNGALVDVGLGDKLIQMVTGELDELDLARWLRTLPQRTPSSD